MWLIIKPSVGVNRLSGSFILDEKFIGLGVIPPTYEPVSKNDPVKSYFTVDLSPEGISVFEDGLT